MDTAGQTLHADFERSEQLLRAAGVLLAGDAQLDAVRHLHAQAVRAAGQASTLSLGSSYGSGLEAEEEHRRLVTALAEERRTSARRLRWKGLRERWTQWLAWAVVALVVGGLALSYGAGLVDRFLWLREHRDGPWISRYYKKPRFRGTPFVRYDVSVNHDWGRDAPVGGMPRNRWSTRWDTCVIAKTDLELHLRLTANYSAKLLVDGKLQIDVRTPGKKKRVLHLPAGVRHLRLNFEKLRGPASVKLEGLDFAGTDAYGFRRPILENGDVHCEDQSTPETPHTPDELGTGPLTPPESGKTG